MTGGGRALLQVSLALSPDGEALADRELGNPWDESDAPIAERSWRAIILGFVGGKFADKNKEVQVVGVVANAMEIRKVMVHEADVVRRSTEVDVSAFLESYPPSPVEAVGGGGRGMLRGARGGVGRFDVRPFGNLLRVAKAVGLLEGRGWLVPYEKAQGFLGALSGEEVRI